MSLKKVTGILFFSALLGVALIWILTSDPADRPFLGSLTFVFFLLGLVSIVAFGLACFFGYFLVQDWLRRLKHSCLHRYGVKTVGQIVSSTRCDEDGDTCLCGQYRYMDLSGKRHEGKFKICIHWPDDEQMQKMASGYSTGATDFVYYWRFLPAFHVVDFPV